MLSLKHPYIQVSRNSELLFGGSQSYMKDKTMSMVGCGVVAAVDTLMYLHLYHMGCRAAFFDKIHSSTLEFDLHERLSECMRAKFLPLIPHFGINGLELVWSVNSYLRRYHIPLKASLGKSGTKLFEAVDEMLSRDMPVILSIGPNFPAVWGKKLLPFYTCSNDERYVHACSAKAHYVTVTGSDENWLEVSSWGRKFYIKKQDYLSYTKENSIPLFNTIVYFSEAEK